MNVERRLLNSSLGYSLQLTLCSKSLSTRRYLKARDNFLGLILLHVYYCTLRNEIVVPTGQKAESFLATHFSELWYSRTSRGKTPVPTHRAARSNSNSSSSSSRNPGSLFLVTLPAITVTLDSRLKTTGKVIIYLLLQLLLCRSPSYHIWCLERQYTRSRLPIFRRTLNE